MIWNMLVHFKHYVTQPSFLSIVCLLVLVVVIYDKTTMVGHKCGVLQLHCQYRDGFVTAIMCIEDKGIVVTNF